MLKVSFLLGLLFHIYERYEDDYKCYYIKPKYKFSVFIWNFYKKFWIEIGYLQRVAGIVTITAHGEWLLFKVKCNWKRIQPQENQSYIDLSSMKILIDGKQVY